MNDKIALTLSQWQLQIWNLARVKSAFSGCDIYSSCVKAFNTTVSSKFTSLFQFFSSNFILFVHLIAFFSFNFDYLHQKCRHSNVQRSYRDRFVTIFGVNCHRWYFLRTKNMADSWSKHFLYVCHAVNNVWAIVVVVPVFFFSFWKKNY